MVLRPSLCSNGVPFIVVGVSLLRANYSATTLPVLSQGSVFVDSERWWSCGGVQDQVIVSDRPDVASDWVSRKSQAQTGSRCGAVKTTFLGSSIRVLNPSTAVRVVNPCPALKAQIPAPRERDNVLGQSRRARAGDSSHLDFAWSFRIPPFQKVRLFWGRSMRRLSTTHIATAALLAPLLHRVHALSPIHGRARMPPLVPVRVVVTRQAHHAMLNVTLSPTSPLRFRGWLRFAPPPSLAPEAALGQDNNYS